MNGLWSDKPMEFIWNKESESYFDKTGEYDIEVIGLSDNGYWRTFSSTKKKDVELFIEGSKQTMKQIANLMWIVK